MDIRCLNCKKKLSRRRKSGLCKKCFLSSSVGSRNPNWKGEEVSAAGMHMRVKAAKGYASEYVCFDCGDNAKEWSQKHDSNAFLVSSYVPRCYVCHRAYDYDIIHSPEANAKMSAIKTGQPGTKCLPDCNCGRHNLPYRPRSTKGKPWSSARRAAQNRRKPNVFDILSQKRI